MREAMKAKQEAIAPIVEKITQEMVKDYRNEPDIERDDGAWCESMKALVDLDALD